MIFCLRYVNYLTKPELPLDSLCSKSWTCYRPVEMCGGSRKLNCVTDGLMCENDDANTIDGQRWASLKYGWWNVEHNHNSF